STRIALSRIGLAVLLIVQHPRDDVDRPAVYVVVAHRAALGLDLGPDDLDGGIRALGLDGAPLLGGVSARLAGRRPMPAMLAAVSPCDRVRGHRCHLRSGCPLQ